MDEWMIEWYRNKWYSNKYWVDLRRGLEMAKLTHFERHNIIVLHLDKNNFNAIFSDRLRLLYTV